MATFGASVEGSTRRRCARYPDLPVVDAQTLNCKAVLVDFAVAVVAFATAEPRSECVDRIRATIECRIEL